MRAAVVALNGVIEATVTLNPPEAKVKYWPNKVTVQQIIQAIQNAGYGASVK